MADIKTHASLPTDLVSAWLTDESGLLTDLHGSNDLTNVGATLVGDGGLNGDAGDFESDSDEYMHVTDPSLDFTGDFSIQMWVNQESTWAVRNRYLIRKEATTNQKNYVAIGFNSGGTDTVRFQVASAAATMFTLDVPLWSNLANGTWYHLMMTYDASAGTFEMFVDGVSQGTATGGPATVFGGTSAFRIGNDNVQVPDGLVHQVAAWGKVVTGTEIGVLYNGGAGIRYEDVASGNVTVVAGTDSVAINEIAVTVTAGSGGGGGGTLPTVDTVGALIQVAAGASVGGAFNNVAGNYLLVMVGESVAASSLCTGVTYNGVALIKLNEGRVGTTGRFNTMWGWDIVTNGAAPTGSNTLTATFSSSVTYPGVIPISYNDVSTVTPIGDDDVSTTDSASSIENTLVTTGPNSLMVLMGRDPAGNRTYTVSEGTIRFNTNGSGYVIADLDVASIGSETFTLSDAGATTLRIGMAVELMSQGTGEALVIATTESVTITEIAPTINITGPTVVGATTDTITITEVPIIGVAVQNSVTVADEGITITEIQPGILASGDVSLTVNTPGSVVITEVAPTVTAIRSVTASMSVETLTISEPTPTIILNDPDVTVIIETEVLTITDSGRAIARGYRKRYPEYATSYSS